MQAKAAELNKSVDGKDGFKDTPTSITSELRRSDIVGVNAHRDAGDNTDEEYQEIINKWKPDLWKPIIEKGIPPLLIYNGDQLGLLYSKLPNRVCVSKKNAKNVFGVRQMKDKSSVTLIFCTAADREKVLICVILKRKKPHCFHHVIGKDTPVVFFYQKNAWFHRNVSAYYINLL